MELARLDWVLAGWHHRGVMTQIQNGWTTALRQPGYFGKHRAARHAAFDEEYGMGNWRIAWEIPGYTDAHALDYLGMCVLYEESYLAFLRDNATVLAALTALASDVYDDAESNVTSRFDYAAQETDRTHVQDIAIRRSVLRLGESFHGTELVQIRDKMGKYELSVTLSPGRVPFIYPDKLVRPELSGKWWAEGSVESFYQSNKVVQVRA